MLKSEIFSYYKKCTSNLKDIYEFLQTLYEDDFVDELCKIRGYVSDEQKNLIQEMNLGYCSLYDILELGDMRKELGLITKSDDFLLEGRFIIPVYDIANNLVALIGYYPDDRKYITTPSPFFSKECLFFNFRHAYDLAFSKYDGLVFLVEGIFDCLSLRSIGLPAMATMGSTVSSNKGDLLKLFKRVIAIPDDDKTGHRALNRYDKKYGWKVPSNTTMVKFHGGSMEFNGTMKHCKDIDNLVSWYDADSVIETLLSLRDSKEEIEVLDLR